MRGLTLLSTVLVAILLQGAPGATNRAESAVDANTKIAYSCNGGICVIYPDGSGRQQLTRDLFIDSYPSWSPDGRSIAFTGNLGRTVIDIINADGTASRRDPETTHSLHGPRMEERSHWITTRHAKST